MVRAKNQIVNMKRIKVNLKRYKYIIVFFSSLLGFVFGLGIGHLFQSSIDRRPHIKWLNGVYWGDTLRAMPHGQGELVLNNIKYEGDWQYGELPEGKVTTPDYIYYGPLDSLKMSGFGKAVYNDSSVYYGAFINGKRSGLGKQFYTNNSIEFGQYTNDIKSPNEHKAYQCGANVYGIDVSHHQGIINWEEIVLESNAKGEVNRNNTGDYLQPVLFAIIKSSEGKDIKDDRFDFNFSEAKRCGIIRGAYHFFTSSSTGEEQANNYIACTELKKGDFPPILDIENNSGIGNDDFRKVINEAKVWLDVVENHYGVRPIIYTTKNIYDTFIASDVKLVKYKMWIANPSNKNYIIKNCIMVQISHTATLNAIPESKNKVDLDLFVGDYSALKQYLSKYGPM